MIVAINTNLISKEDFVVIKHLFQILKEYEIKITVSKELNGFLKKYKYSNNFPDVFENSQDLRDFKVDFFISIGGDGTFLAALLYIKDSGIPVIGINTGRLGFLSYNPTNTIRETIKSLINKNYEIENRCVLKFDTNKCIFNNDNYALNDFTIHKRDNSSLTAITMYLNGDFFNTYWGDGIIVSTPTGSTAYSLSCGGPIVFPESNNFVITPVSPHNLNVRPVIVPDNVEITFEMKSRERNFLISLDSRYKIINNEIKLKILKAPFSMKTVRIKGQSFSGVIREKLMWGKDRRNF